MEKFHFHMGYERVNNEGQSFQINNEVHRGQLMNTYSSGVNILFSDVTEKVEETLFTLIVRHIIDLKPLSSGKKLTCVEKPEIFSV